MRGKVPGPPRVGRSNWRTASRPIWHVRGMSAEVDPNRFFEDLGDGSAFEVVLRGHLWVEHELLRSLTSALPYPDRVDLDRLPFGLKVGLVAAHGLMRADEVPG